MRALQVVFDPESIEGALLRLAGVPGRRSCLALQGQVHPFVTAILLRLSRVDSFDANAQANQPDRKLAQTAQSCRGEWRPVIAADRFRQPKLAERRLEHLPHFPGVGVADDLAASRYRLKASVSVNG